MGIFQTWVYGLDGLQTRVPGFDYVSHSVQQAAGGGHLSEALASRGL